MKNVDERQAGAGRDCGQAVQVVVPDGFRLLTTGETIRKGDIYCRGMGQPWHDSVQYGARWNIDDFWPVARKVSL